MTKDTIRPFLALLDRSKGGLSPPPSSPPSPLLSEVRALLANKLPTQVGGRGAESNPFSKKSAKIFDKEHVDDMLLTEEQVPLALKAKFGLPEVSTFEMN